MITIFNRRELFLTYSMEEQARIRTALQAAGIDYTLRTSDAAGSPDLSGRGRVGSVGTQRQAAIPSVFYVRKKDWDRGKGGISAK